MSKFLLALVLGVSALTVSTGAAVPAASAAPPCSFDRLPDDVDTSDDGDGVPRYLAWSQTEANQQVLESLHQALATLFGAPDAAQGLRQLDNGLIGLVLDHREQRFVVVLSRHLKVEELQGKIARLVPETRQRGTAPVVVQHGCRSSRALARTMRTVARGRVVDGRFATLVDAATSRVQVTLSGQDASELRQLPHVAIGHGDVRSRKGMRTRDYSPHYGAASISRPNGVTCTSWATVKRNNGRRMGLTAGHCGANGSKWRSGPFFYGTARGKRNFPEQDSMRLHGKRGHKWRPVIHVRGKRVVVGDNNPRVGDVVCKSGQTTGVVCGIEVRNTSAVACYAGGCNHNLFYAKKPGTLVGQGGDSGGPVFRAMSDKRAGIRGMEVAGSAYDDLFAEKARVIRRHLGVSVLKR